MIQHGFLRVATAVPQLRVADCAFNAERIGGLLEKAAEQEVAVVVFPELCITGYTCGDLFHQTALQRAAVAALGEIVRASAGFAGLAVVGVPLLADGQLFNCACVLQGGQVLGVVPKSFIPNYKEFYERRWFAPAGNSRSQEVQLLGRAVPFGGDLLFAALDVPELQVGVEVCEDLWTPSPPSGRQALAGATVLLNLSASNEIIGKAAYRRQLVLGQSGRCLAAYAYASCGVWESTTDVVFGGHCLIAENGILLAESRRCQRRETLLAADVDLQRLCAERVQTNSFGDAFALEGRERLAGFRVQRFLLGASPQGKGRGRLRPLLRTIDPHPFVPPASEQLRERCDEIFHTQVAGLARRLEYLGEVPLAIGVSGGLDSTLALLVACKTMDALHQERSRIRAFTMPGFGTSARTFNNARALMGHLGVTAAEVDIRGLCLDEMRALGHRPFAIELDGLDVAGLAARLQQLPAERPEGLVFENVQARMRTSLLMNAGFVIGTSDLSELALGWTTYNADHMSMYNPNVSIPKTLVRFLVEWVAQNEFDGDARQVLLDIVGTAISPELLPPGQDGAVVQETEKVVGPYELHDFFLFHFLRYGAPPEKILFLAREARFDRPYTADELRRWLRVFIQRFFANQFKRSCLPDGPKVGTISLSPRGDWRMPSDAEAAEWLRWAGDPAVTGAAGKACVSGAIQE